VENEWGRIEEITGTYVVVRIWDDRRLVVPLQYFIEKPFQNWTRRNSSIIGSVFFWVDYAMPLEPLREELRRLCKEVPELWDGRVIVLQVTDTSEKSVQLRVLVSSPDSSRNWDLRCHLRENLIGFVQRQYPHCLPQLRADLSVGRKPGVDHSVRLSNTAADGSSARPSSTRRMRRRSRVIASNTPDASQRWLCWYTTSHGGRSLGIYRHGEPVRTIQRMALNTSRRSCSRCGASSFISVRYDATKSHSSSVTSLGYGFLAMQAVPHNHGESSEHALSIRSRAS